MKVVTFNIRHGLGDDGANSWAFRRDALADLLGTLDADIVCLQEVLAFQLAFLAERMPGYQWYGVGRDDGNAMGEFAPVFIHARVSAPRAQGTFWLSETPTLPGSMGWGAQLPRICTFVQLDRIDVFNVHLDHESVRARAESVKLLLKSIREDVPTLLVGDFNMTPDAAPILQIHEHGFTDLTENSGPTYNGWGEDHEVQSKIDYVFSKGVYGGTGEVLREPRVSDHWPLVCKLDWSLSN